VIVTLNAESLRSVLLNVIVSVRRASDPRGCVEAAVRQTPPAARYPAVVAVGKAAPAMLEGFRRSFVGEHDAILVVPEGVQAPKWAIVADHPIPTPRCVGAARKVESFIASIASGAGPHDGFVVLLSGGASALLTLPLPGIELQPYAEAIDELLRMGVGIQQLNMIRKHCELLKGGRMVVAMYPYPCDTYVLSDVVGDELSTVGSGPTVGDPTSFADACKPFEWQLEFTVAAQVMEPFLADGMRGRHQETPKPGDPRLSRSRAMLVGSNSLAVNTAADELAQQRWTIATKRFGVTGEASTVGVEIAHWTREAIPQTALVFGGETTVNVDKRSGRGGRNQEAALAAAIELEGRDGVAVATFATDGIDGPTDAAGAIVTGETCRQARSIGLDPKEFLAAHDSFTFFEKLDRAGFPHLIKTGPTGTNVNDVAVALVG
jgi:hydroxypyruvate reductase